MKELKDTVSMMLSEDYQDRFKAEYYQLKIRYEKLAAMVKNWEEGKLKFTPICSKEIYIEQLNCMKELLRVLEKRAEAEKVLLLL